MTHLKTIKNFTSNKYPKDIAFTSTSTSSPNSFITSHSSNISLHTCENAFTPRASVNEPGAGLEVKYH